MSFLKKHGKKILGFMSQMKNFIFNLVLITVSNIDELWKYIIINVYLKEMIKNLKSLKEIYLRNNLITVIPTYLDSSLVEI